MRARRLTAALAPVPLILACTTGVALGDDISNNLDSTVDAVAEVMALNAGGPIGTTQLYVVQRNGDGKNGCNLTGSTTLTLSVSSSNTAVATVSPSSVTFSSCGDTKTLTVTPVSQGAATITTTQVSNSSVGTFNLAPATFTVDVTAPAPANTAPKVSVAGVTGGASYDKGSVPGATCVVTDTEDGNSTFPATLSSVEGEYAADGIGSQTAGCSYSDRGGLTAVSSETYNIVDPSAPVISHVLTPAEPDGENGWYRDDVQLVWNVADPQSPSSVQKTGCLDQTIDSDQAPTEYSCSATSAGGSTAAESVTLKRDSIGPAVGVTGVEGIEGENGWYTSAVTVEFTATDALSGPAAATETVTSSGEGASVVIESPAFTDLAGNTTPAGASSRTLKIDTQAPNAPKASLSPPANGAGWNNSDVVVHFENAGDNGASGVADCTADVSLTAETSGQTVSGTCTDEAGNTSPTAEVTVMLDKTGPSIEDVVTVVGDEGDNDWYTSDVKVTFTASDNLSGPATATATVTSSGEGETVLVESPAFTDAAGNTTAPGAVIKSYKIDKTDPAIPSFKGWPDGPVYFGDVPAAPTCESSDALSGLASCVVTGGGSSVGEHVYTALATDNAGNTSTATLKYDVLAWTTKGFYSPVDMGGVLNTVKAGSTVPLKFELFAGPTELTSTTDVASFRTTKVACSGLAAVEDALEITSTGGTSLRYDTTAGQFVQNWQTPKAPGTCYSVTMTARDGSPITALFKLK